MRFDIVRTNNRIAVIGGRDSILIRQVRIIVDRDNNLLDVAEPGSVARVGKGEANEEVAVMLVRVAREVVANVLREFVVSHEDCTLSRPRVEMAKSCTAQPQKLEVEPHRRYDESKDRDDIGHLTANLLEGEGAVDEA